MRCMQPLGVFSATFESGVAFEHGQSYHMPARSDFSVEKVAMPTGNYSQVLRRS